MGNEGLKTYTESIHQGVIKMLWFHFMGVLMTFIFKATVSEILHKMSH